MAGANEREQQRRLEDVQLKVILKIQLLDNEMEQLQETLEYLESQGQTITENLARLEAVLDRYAEQEEGFD
jgi:hypothetical protein